MTEWKTSRGASVKAAGAGQGRAVFSRFGGPPDHDGDITERTAFTDGQEVVMSSFNHGSWNPGMIPIGKGVIRVEADRAVFDFELFTDTAAGAEAHSVLKRLGPLAEFSYGFRILDSAPGKWQGKRVRILKKLDVDEVSWVLKGAGRNTELLSLKSDRPRSRPAGLTGAERDEVEHIQLRLIADQLREDMTRDALRKELEAIADRMAVPYSECFRVPTGTRAAAKAAIDSYAPVLGLDPARIVTRWFSEEPADDGPGAFGEQYADFTGHHRLGGRCQPKLRPDEMWLLSTLDEADAWSIAAHELRHLAGGDEEQAEIFEIRARLDRSTT